MGSSPLLEPKLARVERWATSGDGGINIVPAVCTSSVSEDE